MSTVGLDATTVALGGGVFAYVQPDGGWGLNNAGILVGRDEVTLIDTAMTAKRTARLRDAAAHHSGDRPVRTVVNTHDHPDHTYGNYLFSQATIVAHEACREKAARVGLAPMKMLDLDWGDIELRLPDVTFAPSSRLFIDDEPIELLHLGPAHTLDDVVVWMPARKLLFAGDIVVSGTPLLAEGSLRGYHETLARLRALGAETIVPGHGPVTDAACFDAMDQYVRFVEDVARDAFPTGRPPLEAALAADLGAFAGLSERERLAANLHRAYAELSGAPDGAPIAPMNQLFSEMTAMHGAPLDWRVDFPGC